MRVVVVDDTERVHRPNADAGRGSRYAEVLVCGARRSWFRARLPAHPS
jgi:hypothetical protein